MSDGGRFIIFPEQVVEKSTMCANCLAFDADATRVMEEWRPVKEKDVNRIKVGVQFGGLQVPGFDRADVGLKVAELTRSGMDLQTAVQAVENALLQHALAQTGGNPDDAYKADLRYAIVAQTEADILSGKLGRCRGGGVRPDGNPVGFLVMSGYHCHKWSGRTGHSLAHEGNRPLDPLPAELVARAEEKALEKAKKG